jgi:nucleoid-associated protein YgaU
VPQNFDINEPETAETDDKPEASQPGPRPAETRVPAITQEYVVRGGDTWSGIVQDHFFVAGVLNSERVRILAKFNGMDPAVPLRVGDKIKIPPSLEAAGVDRAAVSRTQSSAAASNTGHIEYTVERGDSWWTLAHRKFRESGMTASELQDYNGGVALRENEVIRIPVSR